MNKRYLLVILIVISALISLWVFKTLSGHKKQAPKVFRKAKIAAQPKTVAVKGKVAIVLDDWGYNSSDLSLLFDIKRPVTVSILPNLRYSEKVAREAKHNGYETMLHLPLESRNNEISEKDTIYCCMNQDEIIRALKLSLATVPGISGVNNHQGSKATEDTRTMGIVLAELKNEKLFFLDSLTTDKSVCPATAKKIGLKYAKRDIFLDEPPSKLGDKEQSLYIQKQLYKLSSLAIRKGSAIGIGHDKKITLKVLRDMMPQLEKQGIKFVFMSELAQ